MEIGQKQEEEHYGGYVSDEAIISYITQFYNHKDTHDIFYDITANHLANLFGMDAIEASLRKMANGKALIPCICVQNSLNGREYEAGCKSFGQSIWHGCNCG